MFSFESSLWSQIEEHSLDLSSEKTARSLSIEHMTTEKILEKTTHLQFLESNISSTRLSYEQIRASIIANFQE